MKKSPYSLYEDLADLLIVSPDLLLDPVKVGILVSLASHCLDEGEQVARY